MNNTNKLFTVNIFTPNCVYSLPYALAGDKSSNLNGGVSFIVVSDIRCSLTGVIEIMT